MKTTTPMMLIGTCDQLALFGAGDRAVVLDITRTRPLEVGTTAQLLGRFNWRPTNPKLLALRAHQQAARVLNRTTVSEPEPVNAAGGTRTYSVPKQVQATARRALEAATAPDVIAHADPIAIATARNLSSGTPVTLPKLRQIARALSIRHTVTSVDGATAQDGTGAVYLLWGGNAARRWANGVINREDARAQKQFGAGAHSGRVSALRAAAEDSRNARADGSETNSTGVSATTDRTFDDELDLPDDPTDDQIRSAVFSGDIVPMEWFQDFYDQVAEEVHGFAPSPDRPNLCLYCGAPFFFQIHDVNNHWTPDPEQSHFYSESEVDPDICAVCQKPPTDGVHQFDLGAGTGSGAVIEPEALASYTPYRTALPDDVTPGLLATLMNAEQALDMRNQYYAVVDPHDPDLAVGVLRNVDDAWQRWDSDTWISADVPTEPMQLVDDETALALVQFGLPASIPSFDLHERALVEAARPTLNLEFIPRGSMSDDDDGVMFVVEMDVFEPTTGLGLSAVSDDQVFSWDYGIGTWVPSKFGIPEGTPTAAVPFETAVSVAAQLLDGGTADLALESPDDLVGNISMLEETGFFDLLIPAIEPAVDPDDYWDDEDGDDSYWEVDDLDDDDLDGLFFMLQDPSDAGRALSLYAQPGGVWHVWDPQSVTWRSGNAPNTDNLLAVTVRQATEFAAWQYMQSHGLDALDSESAVTPIDRLSTTLASADFTVGYSAIALHRAPGARAVRHHEPHSLVAATPSEDYTPEERSKNASKQVRDKFGRFAKANSRVMLKSGQTGRIKSIDPERQTVTVEDDDGNIHDVPANSVTIVDEDEAKRSEESPPLDLNKIAAQPRAGARTTKASLPYLLPPLDRAAINKIYSEYQSYIEEQRKKASGK